MTTIEVWGAIVLQDHGNDRHMFLLDKKQYRFDDINELSEYLISQYNKKQWIPNGHDIHAKVI